MRQFTNGYRFQTLRGSVHVFWKVKKKMPELLPNDPADDGAMTRCQRENGLPSKGRTSKTGNDPESHIELQQRYEGKLKIINVNDQVRELQTILRDRYEEDGFSF